MISVEASSEFRVEFRDKRKATSKYVSEIKGVKSTKKVSKAERVSSQGIDSSNRISKSLHASSTVGLKVGGIIHLNHCAAEVKLVQTMTFDGDTPRLLPGVNGRMIRLIIPLGFCIFFKRSYKVLVL